MKLQHLQIYFPETTMLVDSWLNPDQIAAAVWDGKDIVYIELTTGSRATTNPSSWKAFMNQSHENQ